MVLRGRVSDFVRCVAAAEAFSISPFFADFQGPAYAGFASKNTGKAYTRVGGWIFSCKFQPPARVEVRRVYFVKYIS